jgi:hypothetical protein
MKKAYRLRKSTRKNTVRMPFPFVETEFDEDFRDMVDMTDGRCIKAWECEHRDDSFLLVYKIEELLGCECCTEIHLYVMALVRGGGGIRPATQREVIEAMVVADMPLDLEITRQKGVVLVTQAFVKDRCYGP